MRALSYMLGYMYMHFPLCTLSRSIKIVEPHLVCAHVHCIGAAARMVPCKHPGRALTFGVWQCIEGVYTAYVQSYLATSIYICHSNRHRTHTLSNVLQCFVIQRNIGTFYWGEPRKFVHFCRHFNSRFCWQIFNNKSIYKLKNSFLMFFVHLWLVKCDVELRFTLR